MSDGCPCDKPDLNCAQCGEVLYKDGKMVNFPHMIPGYGRHKNQPVCYFCWYECGCKGCMAMKRSAWTKDGYEQHLQERAKLGLDNE